MPLDLIRTNVDGYVRRLKVLQILGDFGMRWEDLLKVTRSNPRTLKKDLDFLVKRGTVERERISHKNVIYRASATTEVEYRLHDAFKILFDILANDKLIKEFAERRAFHIMNMKLTKETMKDLEDYARAHKIRLVKTWNDEYRERRRDIWILDFAQVVHELLIKLCCVDTTKTNLYIGVFRKGKKRILRFHQPEPKELADLFNSIPDKRA